MTYKDLIAKIEKMKFTSLGDRTLESDTFTVGYRTKLHEDRYKILTSGVQLIIYISYKGTVINTWGCVDDTEQQAFVNLILAKTQELRNYMAHENHYNSKTGQALFTNL